ncbi:hypothetical protein GTP46_04710 [Duganella sp. FT135W]|uniref:Uncharacterized protein n=1 Tax=Duganella flavida TaxID=2692175 RepID=A0A6L8K5Y5_9BURK|nr:FlxA-like family protein [Duganella flavida]MYM21947.1 hypothetical protein [Duganella flavida]
MPSAITLGSPPAASTYSTGVRSSVSLQAQLQRYQKQLSDCVNCASAKTSQGKADIEAISERISQIKRAIEQTEKPSAAPGTPNPQTTHGLIDVYA